MFDMMATVITIPLQVKGVVSFAALTPGTSVLSVVLGYITAKAKVALQIITNSNVLYSKVRLNKWPNTAGFDHMCEMK